MKNLKQLLIVAPHGDTIQEQWSNLTTLVCAACEHKQEHNGEFPQSLSVSNAGEVKSILLNTDEKVPTPICDENVRNIAASLNGARQYVEINVAKTLERSLRYATAVNAHSPRTVGDLEAENAMLRECNGQLNAIVDAQAERLNVRDEFKETMDRLEKAYAAFKEKVK